MLFRFGESTTVSFRMRDTRLPLSVAFFAANGTFVSLGHMVPCMTGPDVGLCRGYSAESGYADAVEVAEGKLLDLLIGPGFRLDILDEPCPSVTLEALDVSISASSS